MTTKEQEPAERDKERLYELALAEAERAIVQQQAVLEQLRSRAVGLVAVGSGVATFVGVQAARSGPSGWWLAASVVAYAAGLGLYLWGVWLAARVLMPQKGWKFSVDAHQIVAAGDSMANPGEYSAYVRRLARWTQDDRNVNQPKLNALTDLYAQSIKLLGGQVGCWLLVGLISRR